MLVLDRLCLQTIGAVLSRRDSVIRVVFLDTRLARLGARLLVAAGFDIAELKFNIGEVERGADNGFFIDCIREECALAEKITRKVVGSSPELQQLNELGGKGSVLLRLTKVAQYRIGYLESMIRLPAVVDALGFADCRLMLKQPVDVELDELDLSPRLASCVYYREQFRLTKLRIRWIWQFGRS